MWKELSDQVAPEKRTYSLGLVGQVRTPITDVWKGQVLPEEAGSIDQISPESVKNARDLCTSWAVSLVSPTVIWMAEVPGQYLSLVARPRRSGRHFPMEEETG